MRSCMSDPEGRHQTAAEYAVCPFRAGPTRSLEGGHDFTPGWVFFYCFFVGVFITCFLCASAKGGVNRSSWHWISPEVFQKRRAYRVK